MKKIKYLFTDYPQIHLHKIIMKILYTLTNRNIYEKVITDIKYFDNLKIKDSFYYPNDYPFPNINLIFYNENHKKDWINKINKLYFYKSKDIDKGWYEFN